MATAIRDVELSQSLPQIEDLNGYSRAMLVFRWRGRVVGRVFTPVVNGRLDAVVLGQLAVDGAGVELTRRWLDEHVDYDERAVDGARTLTATVAVCTRERPDDLQHTLEAIVAAAPMADLLVIDNAPASDATRRTVERFNQVRYVHEPRRGLNAARNRALREARGDVVAFTDDDAAPERGWLEALLANFGDPRVLCVTGLTLPRELETEAQEQFERYCPFGRGFRRRVFDGVRHNPLAVGPVGAGANMALRRSVIARVGEFDELLDGGTPTRSGGDHEMFARILAGGFRIVYDPAAVSWHRHRRTEPELLETVRGYGVGVYAMWTGLLWERRELGVLKLAWSWLVHDQLPAVIRSIGARRDAAASLPRAELRGCLEGPRAWFASRRARGARA
jgi:glycosyltransferase involved in cell wall biosynthesis